MQQDITDQDGQDKEKKGLNTTERHLLQQQRIEKRMSITQLAREVQCDVNTIASYERGDEVINNDLVDRISKALSRANPPSNTENVL